MLKKEELLDAFTQLTNCCYPTWSWVLNDNLEVISTNCSSADMFHKMFVLPECKSAVERHVKENENPLICTLAAMLSWVSVFEKNKNGENKIYVFGPFFSGYRDEENCDMIFRILKMNEEEQNQMWRSFQKIPMLTSSTMIQYAIMLHYCIHQKKIVANDIDYCVVKMPRRKVRGRVATDQFDNSSGYWETERMILDKVRRGDMNVSELVEKISVTAPDQYRAYRRNIEKYKASIQVLLTLVSRAAVEGGLSRKTSFSLAADYQNKILQCTAVNELRELNEGILLDYAQRVKRAKKTMQCSAKIRLCCEYINTHLDEKITLEMMAQKSGYTISHLSKKFKAEVGCSIIDYIHNSKIEYAKNQLIGSDKEIEEISSELGIGTRSYFSTIFKKATGETPSDYRKKHRFV